MSNASGPLRSEVKNGIRIDWDVPIQMDDGVILRADVFRPDDAGRYPVILSAGPYGKWLSFQDEVWGGQWKQLSQHEPDMLKLSSNKYQSYEFPDPERFVPDGYALVRVDVRGTGRSPGLMDLLSARETLDFYRCIEWAGEQPWSTGKVGLNGVSYLAMNQWQVAALQPPYLAAMCVWEGCSDFYREFTRHGGIYSLFGDLWFQKYILPVQHGLGERGWPSHVNDGEWVAGPETVTDAELVATRRDWRIDSRENRCATDEFWASRLPDFGRITTPLLSAANWGGHGLHLRGNVEGFQQAGSRQKWLDFHCLEHWTEFYTSRGIALQKRFFDHFLKGEDNGWAAEPRVQMEVRHPTAPFTRRTAAEWPLPETQWAKLHFDFATAELTREPSDRTGQVAFQGSSDGVTFISRPLKRDVQLIGPGVAKLFASSSTTDADLFVIVRLFTPDLKEVTFAGANDPHSPLAHGWLRASMRKLDPARSLPYRPYHSLDEPQPLTPGQVYELDIEIWPTCIVAPAGYRLAVTIRGKDYEYPGDLGPSYGPIGQPARGVGPFRHQDEADRPPAIFGGEITLHTEAKRTPYLVLPVIPDAKGAAAIEF
ncbi:MAG: CocE/NonD family hydrolase [Candidatus Binatia bacterium]